MNPILVVDDEPAIADLIAMTLAGAGYVCEVARDGLAAADLLEESDYALALLDIMLPEIDGYDLLDYARSLSVPVIFITAKGTLKDRVKGLSLGADDYITKPFEPEELVARVGSVLRRSGALESSLTLFGVTLDPSARTVTQDGVALALTPREFDLLRVLMQRPGALLARDELYRQVWQDEADYDSRTLDLHITRIRKKLGWQDRIRSVYKVGYRLEGEP